MSFSSARRGGTFCQFRIGARGASDVYLSYISRESAVWDRERGVLLYGMPKEINAALDQLRSEGREDYAFYRLGLIAHGWIREAKELATHSPRRLGRTHYRAILSFEVDVGTQTAKRLTEQWLVACFPTGQAIAFVHRDTPHLHIHVWLDSRGRDGKKLNLPAARYRTLDERWNELYAPAVGRDIRDHLHRKERGREDRLRSDSRQRTRMEWRQKELKIAGADELEKIRTRSDQPELAASALRGEARERTAPAGESAIERSLEEREHAARAAQRAVSEADRLREALTRLGEREREVELEKSKVPER